MNLCVFQGTFNPIHNAHIRMAEFVLENYDADKILFIPAYKPPHKVFDPECAHHRLNMVKLAVEDNPRFEVSDIEFQSEEVSYTYNTIKTLTPARRIDLRSQRERENFKIYFIIGADAYGQIDTWYRAAELKEMVEFIVFTRTPQDISSSQV
ncbi:MAG: nicotinate (nicotinamide) nucleotide adenylyltransferase, partial [Heliobacteriaceae bacterium]|nr:nicotinate (nicotinamide) nucleotide adenylyltransferase [Heliobacteriaceae bacterium]